MVESERGWGQEYWNETFYSEKDRKARMRQIDNKNKAEKAPDWYISYRGTSEIEIDVDKMMKSTK